MMGQKSVERQKGVALWRQIADRIRASIAQGDYDASGMVPGLCGHFYINTR